MVAAAVLVFIFAAPTAAGHDVPPTAFSQIWQEGNEIRYELSISYDDLAHMLAIVEPAIGAPVTDLTRALALADRRDALTTLLTSSVRLSLERIQCVATLGDIGVETFQGNAYATISLRYACAGPPSGSYELHYDLFLEAEEETQANLVDFTMGNAAGRVVLHADERHLTMGEPELAASAGRFVRLGIEHIFGGLDHVLFILALVLGAHNVRDVLKAATAFTAAHSVTLALAALGIINVPARVVEPVIALSIAYVALEGALRPASRYRLWVVFGFGLLHGLGFASTLNFTDELSWRLLASLATFNLGIEFGQAMIIVVVAPLVFFARRMAWARVADVSATGLITAFGIFWFMERLVTT